jgi:SPP1 gp7 family putative phage head morphogenesis protein
MSTPEALYRNAIDLNRYSNSVARRIINAYNDIIIDAVNQLRTIDELAAPVKAARLRAILAQLKDSLGTWAGDATELTATELQGIAQLQSEFVTDQLRRALPAGARDAVRTVEISPQFAQSVVTTDPTQLNVVALSDDLFKSVYGADALAQQAGTGTFSLTAAKGATITLPNGRTVEKAFRGIAVDQAERFSQVVRQGLLTGEPTPAIAKRLIGTLEGSGQRLVFGQAPPRISKTLQKIIAAGGELTSVTDNQITALVRTSINQVANTASQQVYEANPDITNKYRYVATLDTRTSAICRALDGKEFPYGKGPMPPQHFNCLPGFAHVSTSGRIAAVYRRLYEGDLYLIETSNGHMLRVTPNHPVLTANGWKPANLVQVGDKVFTSNVIPSKSIADNQKDNAATTAEDVFRAFRESPAVFSVEVPTTAPDFHGDAASGKSAEQVAVVLADRKLLLAVNPGLLKALLDFGFQGANPAASSGSHFEHGLLAVGNTALCGMGSRSQGLAFSSGSAGHAGELLLAPVPQLATRFQDDSLYGTWRDAEALRDAANADALIKQGYDQADVCWIGRLPFSGHVYNFETEGGTYCADAILTHNCRSTTVPVIDYEGLGFTPPPEGTRASAGGQVPADTTYGEWLAKQPLTVKAKALGAGKVAYFDKLSEKYGPSAAITKLVRDDGSELTLNQLRARYGAVKER